ncbi:hypothetical protein PV797_01680 [Clostridiaceae bacterium M8S5]|nr:hypothetical protein PV797_01680 [Clostridiaceae bacterium M8S5]
MYFIIFVVIVIVAVFGFYQTTVGDRNRITEKISSIGGTLINYEKRGIFSGSPFKIIGRGVRVYKVSYEINGEQKIGWVKIGGLFGPDWKL